MDDARHLLVRTGFAPPQSEVTAFAGLTREEAVERRLAVAASSAAAHMPPPAWVGEPVEYPARLRNQSEEERRAFQQREALRHAVDFRQLYATLLERYWSAGGACPRKARPGGRPAPKPFWAGALHRLT